MSEKFKNKQESLEAALQKAKEIPGELVEFRDDDDMYIVLVTKVTESDEKAIAKLKRRMKAREIVQKAQERALKHLEEGWTEENFKKQYLEAQRKISEFLSKK